MAEELAGKRQVQTSFFCEKGASNQKKYIFIQFWFVPWCMLPFQFMENNSLSIQWHLGQSERSPVQTLRYIQANRIAVLINFSTS